MENIYKVKIKTSRDPHSLYPSERRYSASTVLGLSICHLIFCVLVLIFAVLSLLNLSSHGEGNINNINIDNKQIILQNGNADDAKQEYDTSLTRFHLILTPLMLTLGGLFAGLTGLLAWKRWYIDSNIKWFFFTSLLASFLAVISVTYSIIIYDHPQVKIHINIQIFITSVLELIISVISVALAYSGMKNIYPDDIELPNNRGKIEVNTITKSNKKCRISPPDILNHFHVTGKFAKYFPRKESRHQYLPKAESNVEYHDRVRKFLSSNTENSGNI